MDLQTHVTDHRTRTVPFLNLQRLFEQNRNEYLSTIENVVKNARFIGGKEVEAFEKEFADWIGQDLACCGCGNGTDAITLAVKAMNLPAGSEAILPAMTFIASAEGVMTAGLSVKLVDIDPKTWVMDADQLAHSISPKTRLILPVHLYGQMAAMDTIRAVADRHGCKVLEDAAQAHGARWMNKPVGHFGDAATFSFFPGKNLGAFGDAGAVVSKNRELVLKASAHGKHGGLKKYVHDFVGGNSRLDGLQAAILRVKLKYLSDWTDQRRKIAAVYRKELAGLSQVTLPVEHENAKHVYHLFVVQVPDREAFQKHLLAHGVETGVHYPKALHQLAAFADYDFSKQEFPASERLARHGVSIPMCPTMTEDDAKYVANAVRSFR